MNVIPLPLLSCLILPFSLMFCFFFFFISQLSVVFFFFEKSVECQSIIEEYHNLTKAKNEVGQGEEVSILPNAI